MSSGPKSGWGGRRPGAGRPPAVIPNKALKPLLRALRVAKKTTGKDVFELLVGFAYGDSISTKDRILAIKIILDRLYSAPQEQEQTAKAPESVARILPPLRPDPADFLPRPVRTPAAQ